MMTPEEHAARVATCRARAAQGIVEDPGVSAEELDEIIRDHPSSVAARHAQRYGRDDSPPAAPTPAQ
jgi:hypothetical protein